MLLADYIPALRYGALIQPHEVIGGAGTFFLNQNAHAWYVDGSNGSDSNNGRNPAEATATIGKAIGYAADGDVIYIFPKKMAALATDPNSYAETVIIPNGKALALIGTTGLNRSQGGLPQMKINAGSTPMINIKTPGCLIANIGINGINSTGGGITLTDDGGTTAAAFGTSIINCHFKNCVGSNAASAVTGGAIQLSGAPWQVRIAYNTFFNNAADVTITSNSSNDAKDLVIQGNSFSGPAATVDCNVFLPGTLGNGGIVIRDNVFPCFPAVASGVNLMPIRVGTYAGILGFNAFGTTGKTYGAAANVIVPTTMLMAGNWQESGLIART